MELGKDTKDAAKFEKKQSRVKSRGIFWSQLPEIFLYICSYVNYICTVDLSYDMYVCMFIISLVMMMNIICTVHNIPVWKPSWSIRKLSTRDTRQGTSDAN
jgi:hypothetical protein